MTTIKVGAGPFMKSSLKNLDLDKFSIIRYYRSCSSTPQSAIPAGILISLIWPEAGIRVVLPQFETESITIFGRDGKNMCWIQFFTWPDQPSPSGSLKLPVFTWLLQRQGFPVWDFGDVALGSWPIAASGPIARNQTETKSTSHGLCILSWRACVHVWHNGSIGSLPAARLKSMSLCGGVWAHVEQRSGKKMPLWRIALQK